MKILVVDLDITPGFKISNDALSAKADYGFLIMQGNMRVAVLTTRTGALQVEGKTATPDITPGQLEAIKKLDNPEYVLMNLTSGEVIQRGKIKNTIMPEPEPLSGDDE